MNERPAPVEPAELTDQELLRTYNEELLQTYNARNYINEERVRAATIAGLRAVIAADRARRAAPPAEGEVGTLVAALRGDAACIETGELFLCICTADQLTRAADLLQQQAAELAMLRRQAEPPVEGEAWSVAQSLRRRLAQKPMGCADPTLIRAAELLERLAGELATLRSAPHA